MALDKEQAGAETKEVRPGDAETKDAPPADVPVPDSAENDDEAA